MTDLCPTAERPGFQPGYGISDEPPPVDQFPWSRAEGLLREARNYWLSTSRPGGRPHAMPVWGVWAEGGVCFGTNPESVKGRNLAANPEAVIHLESGDDVVILEGVVALVDDAEAVERIGAIYNPKYDLDLDWTGAFRLRPRIAFTWLESDFPATATRWVFEG